MNKIMIILIIIILMLIQHLNLPMEICLSNFQLPKTNLDNSQSKFRKDVCGNNNYQSLRVRNELPLVPMKKKFRNFVRCNAFHQAETSCPSLLDARALLQRSRKNLVSVDDGREIRPRE